VIHIYGASPADAAPATTPGEAPDDPSEPPDDPWEPPTTSPAEPAPAPQPDAPPQADGEPVAPAPSPAPTTTTTQPGLSSISRPLADQLSAIADGSGLPAPIPAVVHDVTECIVEKTDAIDSFLRDGDITKAVAALLSPCQ
jgi:hypothetical protein